MKLFKLLLLIALIVLSSHCTHAQNIGIGTTTPAFNLDIHSTGNSQFNLTEGIGGRTALFSRYTNRLEIQPSDAFEISIGGIDKRNLCIGTNGYVGIANATPNNQLEIGTAPGFSGNNLAIGNGTQGMSFFQSSTASNWYSNTMFSLMPFGSGNGYLGIGTQNPANILQIGSVGSTGYSGNAIAFGSTDATQASGLAQKTSVAQWYSTTNISLMPLGNGQGRVGINSTSPQAPLEVESYVSFSPPPVLGVAVFTQNGDNGDPEDFNCLTCQSSVSIYTENSVWAANFIAASDARIKDIEGISNSLSDLETLNAIKITDYTMKDKLRYNDKPFKKIVAQQVEEVYPQVVSKGLGYIPNVYQLTNKIEKKARGYLLSFKTAHNISKEAKKLQLIDKAGMQQRYNIVAVPSDKEVLIDAPDLKSDTVFVYGEEVNDFRTVDYDGLTTLDISATQELSKLVKQQQKEIDAQNAKIDELMAMVNKLQKSTK